MSVDLKRLRALAGTVKEREAKLKRPVATGRPWEIRNAAGDTAEIYIYDMIGDWGVNASDFVNEIEAITAPNITVRFNSEGGEVFDGVAIYEAIKRHPASSTGVVDSLAASAASFILMACDRVEMAKTARLMIHDAGIGGFYVEGNARQIRDSVAELEDFANLLDSLSDTIAGIYADRAGGTAAEWRAKMEKDRWYTADQAIEEGLADGIVGETATETAPPEETTNRWDPSTFANEWKGVFA